MKFKQFTQQKEYQAPECAILRIEAEQLLCGSTYTVGFANPVDDDEDCTADSFWK